MTKGLMTPERLLDLIACYGAEPGGWPEDERDAAHALLGAEPDLFAGAISEALALDAILMDERTPEPSLALAEKILTAAPSATTKTATKSSRGWLSTLLPGGLRGPIGAVTGSLVIGLASGYAYAATSATPYAYEDMDSAYDAVFDGSVEDMWSLTESVDG